MQKLAFKLINLLLRHALDEAFRQKLPRIYDRLDTEMPFWLRQRITATQMVVVMNQSIAHVIGRNPTKTELDMVRLLYDPVQAAANTVVIRTKGRFD